MDHRGSRQRELLTEEVEARAEHLTAEAVRMTCSFARAERLLGREYHGRFLLELLQNAADAWREDDRSSASRSQLQVVVTDDPALLVANQGAPLTAEVVISSLGHIGASTRPEGEAIGHKGVGFKSVLELTSRPEIYSGLQTADDLLAVRFDARAALQMVRSRSPDWDRFLSQVDNLDRDDPFAGIPVLRFPFWVDDVPDEISRLAEAGYDTVIRLPFADRDEEDVGAWLESVHPAVDALSDPIVLLLDSFTEVTIDDRPRGTITVIRPAVDDGDNGTQTVAVQRNEQPSSSWVVVRDRIDGRGLSSELAVAIRIAVDASEVVSAQDGTPSAAFHLFFPTRIPSGTPFLLHGYFEVDAARTGFYGGSRARNEQILSALARLAAAAVEELVQREPTLACSLVDRLAACPEPEDPLASRLRTELLEHLDEVAWIPVVGRSGASTARPGDVVVLDRLHAAAMEVFDPGYVHRRLGRPVPDPKLGEAALTLIRARQPAAVADDLDLLGELLRPGALDPWPPEQPVAGFRRLLALLDAMRAAEPQGTQTLLTALRRDPTSRLVPTVEGDEVVLRPCADPAAGRPGERSQVLMARVRTTDQPLTPPAALDVDFLPDGALSDDEVDRARPLGVRPFTVDTVLDRLTHLDSADDHEAVLVFLWRLLSREHLSSLSVADAIEPAVLFDPAAFFWCRPGRARDTDTGAPRQRRERNLARVAVPCRDGSWQPAGTVAFGADWADWIDHHELGPEPDRTRRLRALRAMEALASSDADLLATPNVVAARLGPAGTPASTGEVDDVSDELWLLAFLLRLGVWQVPPLEAWDDRSQEGRDRFPWDDALEARRRQLVEDGGGWSFHQRPGRPHSNVWVAEDYRLRWPLEPAAARDSTPLLTALHLGAPLYRDRLHARVFCTGCRDSDGGHRTRHESSADDPFPSHLAVQLQTAQWLPASREGRPAPERRSADELWWSPEPIVAAIIKQHPERFLDRCDPDLGVTAELRELAGLKRLQEAALQRAGALLTDLRAELEGGLLHREQDAPGLARQAFVGLHRRIYRRLAELQAEEPTGVAEVIAATGMLCERGNQLVYEPIEAARHDDGTHAAHLRHFPGELPRVALPRDAESVARALGVRQLELTFHRRGSDDGQDVTSDLETGYFELIPELLAILVHHSLGTQTLEPTSSQFEQRVRRLQNLRIRQVDRLLLDVRVTDTDLQLTLGHDADANTFLEAADTATPVLFHDLDGDGWQDRLRRHLGAHVAAMVENIAYEHTFELFFNRNDDAEREDFLHSLGVRPEDVDRLRQRIGAVTRAAVAHRRRWFAAILNCLDAAAEPDEVDLDTIESTLVAHGLATHAAARLVELGGSETDRRDTGPGSALRTLVDAGIDLAELDADLRRHGDDGLAPRAASEAFVRWRDQHRWLLTGLLAARLGGPDEARRRVMTLRPPDDLRFELEPPLDRLLTPVADALAAAGLDVDASRLAAEPETELARAGGYSSIDELHDAAQRLSDQEAYDRELRDRAGRWRAVLLDVAVLAGLTPTMTRTSIRKLADHVTTRLPATVDRPSQLTDHLEDVLPAHRPLAEELRGLLLDTPTGPLASLDQLGGLLKRHGIALDRLGEVHAARARRRQTIERLRRRATDLERSGIAPKVPPTLTARARRDAPGGQSARTGGQRAVRAITVTADADRRKRQAGDEAEQWALAATLAPMLRLDAPSREALLDELVETLRRRFTGVPVDQLVGGAEQARLAIDDDDAFVDHLAELLHVSEVSDAFGFDVLGWFPLTPEDDPVPLFLEVKSSSGGAFHLSLGEWDLAQQLHRDGDGHRYAVLVVTRSERAGTPARMDLLPDPVQLVEDGRLAQQVAGYTITYDT